MMSGLSRTTERLPAVGVRPAAALAVLLLLVASINMQPAEWDPAHMHVVIGGSDLDKAHALAAHLARMRLPPESDGRAYPLVHAGHAEGSCLAASDEQAHVLSVRAGHDLGIAVFRVGDALAGTAVPALLPPVDPVSRVSLSAHVAMPDPPLPRPEHPPRAS